MTRGDAATKAAGAKALAPYRDAAKTYFAAYNKRIAGTESKLKAAKGDDVKSAQEAVEFCEEVLTPIYHELVASVVTFCRAFTETYGTALTKKRERRMDTADVAMRRAFQKFKHADMQLECGDLRVVRKGKHERIGCSAFSWTEGIGRMITYEKTLGFKGKWNCPSWVPALVHHATIMMLANSVVIVGTECAHEVAALTAVELASWGQTVLYKVEKRDMLVITGSPSRRLERIVGRVDIAQNVFCSCEVFCYAAAGHPDLALEIRPNKLNCVYVWETAIPDPFPSQFNYLFVASVAPKNLPKSVVVIGTPSNEW